jgi:hypothetical protein
VPGLVAIAPTEDECCCYSVSAGLINERRSRRLPEGLPDQPFYGWVGGGGALLRSPLQESVGKKGSVVLCVTSVPLW